MTGFSAFVLTAAVLGGTAATKGSFPGCQRALHEIAASGHSDLEVAVYCHKSLPPRLCRDASGYLGPQPWSDQRIQGACQRWQGQWDTKNMVATEGRAAVDYAMVQQTLDDCMSAKVDAGLCKDQNTSNTMTLNDCIDFKQKVYPEKTKQIEDAIAAFYSATMGSPQQKSEETSLLLSPSVLSVGVFLGVSLIFAAASIGGLIVFKRVTRWHQSRECNSSLIAGMERAPASSPPFI